MKKKLVLISFALLLVSGLILLVCSQRTELPTAEYTIEDVVYVGGISSATKDSIREMKAGTKVIIKDDYLSIIFPDSSTMQWTDIKFIKDKLTDEFIRSKYHEEDKQLMTFFNEYSERYRYSLFDKDENQINYYLFQMDDELFISQFAKDDSLIFSIDKIA